MKIAKMSSTAFAVSLLMICTFAYGAEKRIAKSELPAAVARTVDAVSNGAIIKAYSEEFENRKTEYEVEMVAGGRSRDVAIGPDGVVLEVEEEVPMNQLPIEVQSGLKLKAGSWKINRVESISKQGKLVAYEAQISAGARHSEVQVGPDGKPLDHPE